MNTFRYQAIQAGGDSIEGVIEAEDRKAALQLLGRRGLFPSNLEMDAGNVAAAKSSAPSTATAAAPARPIEFSFGERVRRKDITAFTREMSAPVGRGHSDSAGARKPGW